MNIELNMCLQIYINVCVCLQWFGPNAFKTSNNKPYRLQDTYTHKRTYEDTQCRYKDTHTQYPAEGQWYGNF